MHGACRGYIVYKCAKAIIKLALRWKSWKIIPGHCHSRTRLQVETGEEKVPIVIHFTKISIKCLTLTLAVKGKQSCKRFSESRQMSYFKHQTTPTVSKWIENSDQGQRFEKVAWHTRPDKFTVQKAHSWCMGFFFFFSSTTFWSWRDKKIPDKIKLPSTNCIHDQTSHRA